MKTERITPVVLVLAILCWITGGANGAEVEALLGQWLSAQSNLVSWSAPFVQTRYLKSLTQPLTAEGRVWFSAPNNFRWELGQPAKSIALRTEDGLLVLSPSLKRAERYSITDFAKGPMKDLASLLDTGFPRDAMAFRQKFIMLGADGTNSIMNFRFQARDAAVRKLIPEVIIGVSTNDWMLRSTSIRFADGSLLRNDFASGVTNAPVEPSLFIAPINAEWTVTEPMKRP